jgi:hypothetical protein
MRQVTDHKIEMPGYTVLGIDNALTIRALGEPGLGNACHEYQIINTVHEYEDIGRKEDGSPDRDLHGSPKKFSVWGLCLREQRTRAKAS